MGFETVIAAIMVTAVILAVAYTFISGSTSIAELSIESYKEMVDITVRRLQTQVAILNVTYDNATNTVSVLFKNAGEIRFPDFDEFDVILYGKTEAGDTVAEYLNSTTFTIARELINPGIFDPHEVAWVNATPSQPLQNGTYVVLLCTPNAICDSEEFTVP